MIGWLLAWPFLHLLKEVVLRGCDHGSSWTQAIETLTPSQAQNVCSTYHPHASSPWRKQPCESKVWLWFSRTSLAVLKVKTLTSTAKGMGLFPSQGTEVSLATWPDYLGWICDWSQIRPPCKLSRFWGQMCKSTHPAAAKQSLAGKFPCLLRLPPAHLEPPVPFSLFAFHVWAPVYKPTLTDMFCFLSEV